MSAPDERFAGGKLAPQTNAPPTAILTNTVDYLVEAHDRLTRRRGPGTIVSAFAVISAIPLLIALFLTVGSLLHDGPVKPEIWYLIPALCLAGVVMMAASIPVRFVFPRVHNWYVRLCYARSQYVGLVSTVEFTAKGLHFRSRIEDSLLKWPVFTTVQYFRDGFLLYGLENARWFPKSAFENEENWYEARALLNENLEYETVE